MSSRTQSGIYDIGTTLRYVPRRSEGYHDRMPVESLVQRRIELNDLLKTAKLCSAAIPHLAAKPWARSWRSSYTRDFDRSARRCQKELKSIADRIGPAPKFFKPRPSTASDAKIARLYKPGIKATPVFPWRAYAKLARIRAARQASESFTPGVRYVRTLSPFAERVMREEEQRLAVA